MLGQKYQYGDRWMYTGGSATPGTPYPYPYPYPYGGYG